MAILWLVLLLFLGGFASTVHATGTWLTVNQDYHGAAYGAFQRIHYIDSLGMTFSAFSPNFENNRTNAIEWRKHTAGPVWGVLTQITPDDPTNGPYNNPTTRDNYISFYVPRRNEYWVWHGSHMKDWDDKHSGSLSVSSGRLSFAGCSADPAVDNTDCGSWVARGRAPQNDVQNNPGAFRAANCEGSDCIDLIKNFTEHGASAGAAWNSVLDMGLIYGGVPQSQSVQSTVIVRNLDNNLCQPGQSATGSEQYIACDLPIMPRTPTDSEWVACGTTTHSEGSMIVTHYADGTTPYMMGDRSHNVLVAGDGNYFYMIGGKATDSNDCMRVLWRFDGSQRNAGLQWSKMSPPPLVGQGGVLVYDSTRNKLYYYWQASIWAYDIATDAWSADIAPPKTTRCLFDHAGVYNPKSDTVIYEGGYDCANGDALYDVTQAWDPGGGFYIPPRTWVAVPYTAIPGSSPAYCPGCGGQAKHLRSVLNPDNGKIYFNGGDLNAAPGGDTIGGWPIITFDVTDHTSTEFGTFREDYTHCGAQGDIERGRPDEVGWTWDTSRHQFWMMNGFFMFSQTGAYSCGGQMEWTTSTPLTITGAYAAYFADTRTAPCTQETNFTRWLPTTNFSVTSSGSDIIVTNINMTDSLVCIYYQTNGYALHQPTDLIFNPTTHKFSIANVTQPYPWGNDNAPKGSGDYDARLDAIWRAGKSGSFGNYFALYYLSGPNANTWSYQQITCASKGTSEWAATNGWQYICDPGNVYMSGTNFNAEALAVASTRHKLYIIDPFYYYLIEYDMDTGQATLKKDPPIPLGDNMRSQNIANYIAYVRSRPENDAGLSDTTIVKYDEVADKLYYLQSYACALDGCGPFLHIYDPATNEWTTDERYNPTPTVNGGTLPCDYDDHGNGESYREICTTRHALRGANMALDTTHNLLMIHSGGRGGYYDPNLNTFFLWRYGPSTAAAPPATVNPSITLGGKISFSGKVTH